MTGSQYKNVIIWTLFNEKNSKITDSIDFARKLFNNLGVAFPHGDYSEVCEILKNEKYLGWRICDKNQVQKYANAGITSMQLNSEKIIIITPDTDIMSLSSIPETEITECDCIKHSSELNNYDDCDTLCFFVYSYGYKFNDN